MSFEGVKFNKGQGGLNRLNASTDAVMAIVVHTPQADAASLNQAIRCIQASDLDALEYNEAYDANNGILLRHHVEEFFAYAPEGTLFVVPTEKTTAALFFASPEAGEIFREFGDIKRAGFVYNADVALLDLLTEATACQAFINGLAEDHILLDGIYLEGRNIGVGAVSLRELTAGNVTAVIAQDMVVAALNAAYAKYAAVGSVLGMRAARKVNENLGSVDVIRKPLAVRGDISYPLTREEDGRWLKAALSDGTPVSKLSRAQRKQLTDFGYVYAGSFQGFPGYYFNGEPTCIELASDYSSGENNGVWNKAARGVRASLLPKVRGWFKRNIETGALAPTQTSHLENIASKALNQMLIEEEISGFDVAVPDGQSPNDQTPLKAKVTVFLGAIVHEFEVDLSLN